MHDHEKWRDSQSISDDAQALPRVAASLRIGWILSAIVILLILIVLLTFTGILGGIGKFGGYVILALGLGGSAVIAGTVTARALAVLYRSSSGKRGLILIRVALYAIIIPLSLPAVAVWATGETTNPFWWVIYGSALPAAITVAAHASLFEASLARRRALSWQPLLGGIGLTGAVGVSLLFNYVGQQQLALAAIGLSIMTIGSDIAAAFSSTQALGGAARPSEGDG